MSQYILPSGASLPPVAVSGPTLLVVEAGELAVQTFSTGRLALDPTTMTMDTVVNQGERLVLSPGVRPIIRNDGQLPAVVLAIVLEPGPDRGSSDGPARWPNHAS